MSKGSLSFHLPLAEVGSLRVGLDCPVCHTGTQAVSHPGGFSFKVCPEGGITPDKCRLLPGPIQAPPPAHLASALTPLLCQGPGHNFSTSSPLLIFPTECALLAGSAACFTHLPICLFLYLKNKCLVMPLSSPFYSDRWRCNMQIKYEKKSRYIRRTGSLCSTAEMDRTW